MHALCKLPLAKVRLTWISDYGLHPTTACFTRRPQLSTDLSDVEMPVVQRGELEICDDLLVRIPPPV